jgi:hypothetical protein
VVVLENIDEKLEMILTEELKIPEDVSKPTESNENEEITLIP